MINGSNTGSLNVGITFQNIPSLTGGTANDTFTFNAGAALGGSINGSAGTNTLDLSAYSTPVNINLPGSRMSNVGGFLLLDPVVHRREPTPRIVLPAPPTSTTFDITALNAFNVNGVNFSAFRKLIGGAGENTYVLSDGAGLSGSINGGSAGNSWLDYSAYTTAVTVNLVTGSATGFGTAISNIANVRGGIGNDKLSGNSKGNILIGGGGNDTLTGGTGSSLLIGGAGADIIKGGSGAT